MDEKLEVRMWEFCKGFSGIKEEYQGNSGVERCFCRYGEKIRCEQVFSKYVEQELLVEVQVRIRRIEMNQESFRGGY